MNTRAQRQVKVDAHTSGRYAVVLGGSLAGLLETVGGTAGRMTKFMHRYMDHVIKLATRSVAVRTVLMRAFNLLVPPTVPFRPRVLFRVLFQMFRPTLSHAD